MAAIKFQSVSARIRFDRLKKCHRLLSKKYSMDWCGSKTTSRVNMVNLLASSTWHTKRQDWFISSVSYLWWTLMTKKSSRWSSGAWQIGAKSKSSSSSVKLCTLFDCASTKMNQFCAQQNSPTRTYGLSSGSTREIWPALNFASLLSCIWGRSICTCRQWIWTKETQKTVTMKRKL